MNRVSQSVQSFKRFNFREPSELSHVELDLSRPLIRIGEVPEIHYLSDKWGEPAHYVHHVKHPGTLYAHPSGKFFLLLGGSTRVTDWLRENPEAGLSWGNIDRAIRQIQKRPGVLRGVRDKRAYISKVAWKIQRSRIAKLGHR